MEENQLSKIVSLCKRRGFLFQGSEIYGGLANIWDYGPIGSILKKNIKDLWWRTFVDNRDDMVGVDCSQIMHKNVFVGSGHLAGFADTLIECKQCKKRFRVDHLEKISDGVYKCQGCGKSIDEKESAPKKFNLMLKTFLGGVEGADDENVAYLRPETAQGIFVNFLNVLNTMHKKLPFGIAQIGRSFRNELTTGDFIFRLKEFEQMEIEFFVLPEKSDEWYKYWIEEHTRFYRDLLGIKSENLRVREHEKDELAHYAKACVDIEFKFPFGWKELEGIANRGDFDLREHSKASHKELTYFDQEANRSLYPFVVEPSAGADRTFFAVVSDAYCEEEVAGKTRVVLKLNKRIAPYKVAVFPLLKNRPELVELTKKVHGTIKDALKMKVVYDDTGAIGKLYRRQDEIGTPYCVTVDVDSLTDRKVTVRDRDSMKQERVALDSIGPYFRELFKKE